MDSVKVIIHAIIMTIRNINLNNVDSTMICKMNKMILLSLTKEIIYL